MQPCRCKRAGATVKKKACLLGRQGSLYLPPKKDCLGFYLA